MKFLVLIVVALASVSLFAEKQPFERYQSIVDRQMFGPLPPDFDPTKSPNEVQKSSSREEKELTQEQEKLQSSIHFSVINVTPDGKTAVGFTDNSDPKAPVHYYLKVGEKRNGWEVKEADPNEAKMTIAKGDIEVTLALGGNSAKDGGTSKAGAAAAAQPAAAASGFRRPGGLMGARGGGLFGGSLRERRMKRQQEQQAEFAKAQADAAEKEAQREAQRQAQAEQEKQQREAERAEQRQQLLAIQEELKRVREAKATEKAESSGEGHAENAAQ